MKTIFSISLLLISSLSFSYGFSQNLVLNPGFEEYDTIFYPNTSMLKIKQWRFDFPPYDIRFYVIVKCNFFHCHSE